MGRSQPYGVFFTLGRDGTISVTTPREDSCGGYVADASFSAVANFFSLLSEKAKVRSDILIKLGARHHHVFFTWARAVFLLNLMLTRLMPVIALSQPVEPVHEAKFLSYITVRGQMIYR